MWGDVKGGFTVYLEMNAVCTNSSYSLPNRWRSGVPISAFRAQVALACGRSDTPGCDNAMTTVYVLLKVRCHVLVPKYSRFKQRSAVWFMPSMIPLWFWVNLANSTRLSVIRFLKRAKKKWKEKIVVLLVVLHAAWAPKRQPCSYVLCGETNVYTRIKKKLNLNFNCEFTHRL